MTDKNPKDKVYEIDNLMKKRSFFDNIIEYFLKASDKSTFSGKDKILFYKELVYMMKGGVSLMEAMKTIQRTSDN
jgi:type II secretory pathway component PulF